MEFAAYTISVAAMSARRIHRLAPDVVNRIAAGEVIQRPSSAIKELIENSIDAGATRINVVLGQSGLKFLSITDNGCGICKDDFPILCERFTTSKLQEYKDLDSIETFGFRGEALASISHVAHLSVTSKTADTPNAYKASFLDGKMCSEAPQPCAGLQGSNIVIEDLFYSIPMRLNAIKNLGDEYNRCLSTLTHFAVHFNKIAFTLKKQNRTKSDLNTSGKMTREDTVRLLYGQVIAKELLPIDGSESNVHYQVSLNGLVSNISFSSKSFTLILFINQRLVACSSIRKTVESVYASFLPKGGHPFVYLDFKVPPNQIDVNVHPTKREVCLLREDEICELLDKWLHSTLSASTTSRTFTVQKFQQSNPPTETANKIARKVVIPSQMVRTDFRHPAGRLAAYLAHPEIMTLSNSNKTSQSPLSSDDVACNLASVRRLLDEIRMSLSESLSDIFKTHVFVGCVDDHFALIQSSTKLYLINVPAISNCFFYERCLHNFGRHMRFKLQSDPKITVYDLCIIALEDRNSGWTPDDGDRGEIASHISSIFVGQRDMLKDYFSIIVSEKGELVSLPQIVPQYVPPLAMLPMFVLRCGSEVDWKAEEPCFRGLAREIAKLYQVHPGMYINSVRQNQQPSLQWTLEHILFPALRSSFSPPKQLSSDGSVVQIASCESLYKVFERC